MSLGSFYGDIPGAIPHQGSVPAHAAATATEVVATPIRVPYRGTVTAVGFIPLAAATGDNTNTTNLNVINKGQAGAGTTEIANFDPVTGANLVAYDEKLFTIAAAGVEVQEGDVLVLQHEKVASGLAIAAGTWVVYINGNHS